MQRYTIFSITVNALHVSSGFPAHHQELKNCTHSIEYVASLLAATANVGELELTHASGSSKQACLILDAVCTVFEFLMMDGETAQNM
jgi:ribonuclease BN (tRNA processing enzyme)